MKICWDNLENIKYKNGYFTKLGKYYIYNNKCMFCGNPFLQRKDSNGMYCDKNCNSKDHGRKIKGKESKKKLSYKFVKEQIEKKGYELLSSKYINANTKLKVKCDKGHEYKVTYGHFYSGKRCPECSHPSKKHSYDYIKEQIAKEAGYKLHSKEYKGNRKKLLIECDKGHKFNTTWYKWIRGIRCLICAGNQKLTYEFVKQKIENEKGYSICSENYINAREEIEVECDKGHKYISTYDRFHSGKRCPVCSDIKQFSKAEKEIVKYLKTLNIDIIENDRKQIINPLTGRNLEIDIFIPEYHKAIEFNGKYWHSFKDTKQRDKIKETECMDNGIDLLVIDEQDWIDDKNKCLNNIKGFIDV